MNKCQTLGGCVDSREYEKLSAAIKRAIDLADSGLKWPEHNDFSRTYVTLEKVYAVLKGVK